MLEERRETRKQGDDSDRQKRSESEEAQAAAVFATAVGGVRSIVVLVDFCVTLHNKGKE